MFPLPASSRVHDSLSSLLAKGILKVLAIVLAQEVSRHRLTSVLVHALKNLVTGGVAEAGEQRDELSADGSRGLVLEDDLLKLCAA